MEENDKKHFDKTCNYLNDLNFGSSWAALKNIISGFILISDKYIDKYSSEFKEISDSLSKNYPETNDDFVEIKKKIISIVNKMAQELTS